MHDTKEIPHPATRRDVATTVAGALAVVLVVNALAGWYLRRFPRNHAAVVIGSKWERIKSAGRGPEWAILGDSSGLYGIDPEVFAEEMGAPAHNYCVVGHLSVANTAWMLQEYVRRHGPPRGAVVLHTLDVWPREVAPVLLAHIPFPWGFWRGMDPPLELDWRQVGRLLVHRHLTLYSENVSLAQALTRPWEAVHEAFHLREDGFLEWSEETPEILADDLERHRAYYARARFRFSEINVAALERIAAVAEERGFPVYLVAPPLYEEMAALDGFSDYYADMSAAVAAYAAKHPRIRFVLRGPNLFSGSEMQNADHLLYPAAQRYTRLIAAAIRGAGRRGAGR